MDKIQVNNTQTSLASKISFSNLEIKRIAKEFRFTVIIHRKGSADYAHLSGAGGKVFRMYCNALINFFGVNAVSKIYGGKTIKIQYGKVQVPFSEKKDVQKKRAKEVLKKTFLGANPTIIKKAAQNGFAMNEENDLLVSSFKFQDKYLANGTIGKFDGMKDSIKKDIFQSLDFADRVVLMDALLKNLGFNFDSNLDYHLGDDQEPSKSYPFIFKKKMTKDNAFEVMKEFFCLSPHDNISFFIENRMPVVHINNFINKTCGIGRIDQGEGFFEYKPDPKNPAMVFHQMEDSKIKEIYDSLVETFARVEFTFIDPNMISARLKSDKVKDLSLAVKSPMVSTEKSDIASAALVDHEPKSFSFDRKDPIRSISEIIRSFGISSMAAPSGSYYQTKKKHGLVYFCRVKDSTIKEIKKELSNNFSEYMKFTVKGKNIKYEVISQKSITGYKVLIAHIKSLGVSPYSQVSQFGYSRSRNRVAFTKVEEVLVKEVFTSLEEKFSEEFSFKFSEKSFSYMKKDLVSLDNVSVDEVTTEVPTIEAKEALVVEAHSEPSPNAQELAILSSIDTLVKTLKPEALAIFTEKYSVEKETELSLDELKVQAKNKGLLLTRPL